MKRHARLSDAALSALPRQQCVRISNNVRCTRLAGLRSGWCDTCEQNEASNRSRDALSVRHSLPEEKRNRFKRHWAQMEIAFLARWLPVTRLGPLARMLGRTKRSVMDRQEQCRLQFPMAAGKPLREVCRDSGYDKEQINRAIHRLGLVQLQPKTKLAYKRSTGKAKNYDFALLERHEYAILHFLKYEYLLTKPKKASDDRK